MISVAVCDDNKVFLEILINFIRDKFAKNNVECTVSGFQSGKDFLYMHTEKHYDVVFLDIAMPGMNGFDVAKEIRRVSEKTYIIFVTTETGLVYDSFDFRPFQFIPKSSPELLQSRLDYVINKLLLHMNANKSIYFDLPYNEKKSLAPNDIIYIKSDSNYLEIITIKEELRIREHIDNVINMVSPDLFVRVHNRYLVNMKHIGKIDYPNSEILMDNGKLINISRAHKKSLEEAYNSFLHNFS